MENRDRLLRRDPIRLVFVRKSLKTVAECLGHLEPYNVEQCIDTLIEELKMLKQGDTGSMVWGQVTAAIQDGLEAYKLERLGLWPDSKEQSENSGEGDCKNE